MTETNRQDLEALAIRCEQATGPDRELDAEIALFAPICTADYVSQARPSERAGMVTRYFTDGGHGTFVCERYTASVDAALTLVPEGCGVSIWITPDAEKPGSAALRRYDKLLDEKTYSAASSTPALALCAAALRAQAANQSGKHHE